jgi:hypothetical protein
LKGYTPSHSCQAYRLLRARLEAGDIFISDSLRFRSFDADLIPKETWKQEKEKIVKDIDAPILSLPMAEILKKLEIELEAQYCKRFGDGQEASVPLDRFHTSILNSAPP